MRTIGHRSSRTFAGAVFSGCLLALAAVAPAQAQTAVDEFVTERTFFRTNVNGKSVRLEGLIVKRADLTGHLCGFVLGVLAGAVVSRLPPLRNRVAQGLLAVAAAWVPLAAWQAAFR